MHMFSSRAYCGRQRAILPFDEKGNRIMDTKSLLGEVATQLSSFLRVCRVLGLVERFESLVPAATPSPMAQLKLAGRQRQRAKGRRGAASTVTSDLAVQERATYALSDDVDAQAKTGAKKWTWADK